MTISLAAVFIPVLFMGGIVGRLFHEFAVTIGVAILVSGFVSLTLTPMLCSRFLRAAARASGTAGFYAATERVFDAHARRLRAHASPGCCATAARRWRSRPRSWSARSWLFGVDPEGLPPERGHRPDLRLHRGRARASRSTAMAAAPAGGRRDRRAGPERRAPSSSRRRARAQRVGEHRAASSSASSRAHERDAQRRRGDRSELRPEARRRSPASASSCRTRRRSASAASSPRASTSSRSRARHRASSTAARARCSSAAARRCPGSQDVTSDLQIKNPQVHVEIDRDRAAALGVTAEQIEEALYTRLRLAPGLDHLRAEQPVQRDPRARCRSTSADPRRSRCCTCARRSGELVPLDAVATLERTASGRSRVNHSGQLPAVTLSFNLSPGVSLGDGRRPPSSARRAQTLPADRHARASRARRRRSSRRRRASGCCSLIAILVIYMVLGILYESFIHPLTILSGLPFAGFGALLTLLLFRHGAERLRVRRRDHAGRPREEERDHDDRLRARGAARARARRRATRSSRPAWCASGRS